MAISWAKMCEQYEKLGRRDEALEACGTALAKNGPRLQDYELYGKVMFSGRGKLTPDEVKNLATTIEHLLAQPQDAAQKLGAKLECDLGVRTDDLERLERCTAALAKSAPDAPTTVTYQWSFAMQQKRYDDALALIQRAKKVGVPAPGVAKMEDATRSALPLWRQPLRLALVAAALLGAIVTAAVLVRRRRPISAPSPVPATASTS
jgi:tetratricopeptide (TPR) repeat protein